MKEFLIWLDQVVAELVDAFVWLAILMAAVLMLICGAMKFG